MLKFLKSIESTYVKFLSENVQDFPICCQLSSEIIGGYIQKRFQNIVTVIYYGLFDEFYHSWVISDGTLIDFTKLQFDLDDYTSLDNPKTALSMYKKSQKTFDQTKNSGSYEPTMIVQSRFIDLYDKDFNKYLAKVTKSAKFKEYDYRKTKRTRLNY